MDGKILMNYEIIAEIGQNHNGDMVLAKELICAAKENGADVAKFQVFDAENLFGKEGNIWFEYNCKTALTKDNVFSLNQFCAKQGIEFMASVFDTERIDWLEEIGVKRYEIASRSIRDELLLEKLIKTKKPLIASLGMWNEKYFPEELNEYGASFLYCISKYPTKLNELKFSEVDFNSYSGFSDHTVGISASLIALSRGAKILEKHFTLDKKMYGPDHSGSMIPDELFEINQFRCDLEKTLSI